MPSNWYVRSSQGRARRRGVQRGGLLGERTVGGQLRDDRDHRVDRGLAEGEAEDQQRLGAQQSAGHRAGQLNGHRTTLPDEAAPAARPTGQHEPIAHSVRPVDTLRGDSMGARSVAVWRRSARGQPRAVAEGELDPGRGRPGPAERPLLRPAVPARPRAAATLPGADDRPGRPPAGSDHHGDPHGRRPGELRRVPPRAGPRPPQVPRRRPALRDDGRRAAGRAAQHRRRRLEPGVRPGVAGGVRGDRRPDGGRGGGRRRTRRSGTPRC